MVITVSPSDPATEELRLLYKIKEIKDWKHQSVLQGQSTVTLTDLRPETEYEIKCAAMGKLNYSDVIRVTTHPDIIREGKRQEASSERIIMRTLLENLGLAEYYDEKLTLHTVLQIDKNSVTDVPIPGRKRAGGREKRGRALKERCPRAQKNETHILAVGTFRLVERSFGVGGAQAQSALTVTVIGVQRVLHE
ncbi:hypothetical protein Q8A67_023971 [Cirrhinus molitorella]|uniref:Fibronectin type-III domain-containing protein n=1 Tax=Cirrhinus molitorella TaxID=172907 RepID=A0AA88P4F0_9TELE|nr:hypothetical protein Q8A67_023971 [Cirrhinus molitorella]